MTRYRPKFDAVLRYRKHLEEEAQQAFAEAKKNLLIHEEELQRLRLDLQETLKDLSQKQIQGISTDELDLYYRFVKKQYEALQERQQWLRALSEQVEEKREHLSRAAKEKKAVEKIQETHRRGFVKSADKKEQKTLDETAGRRKKEKP